MSCTHDCGCSQAVKDARTDDWGQIAPESARGGCMADFDAPQAPALPRQIEPEDVRVGMLVEWRKGEGLLRDRVVAIEDGTFKGDVVWLHGEDERNGWSFWLIEDAPEPVDPDAAAIEALVTAYRRSPECSTDSVFGEAMLDHLRAQGFDVTPRAEQ